MLDAGESLVPGFRQSRAVHAWAGRVRGQGHAHRRVDTRQ